MTEPPHENKDQPTCPICEKSTDKHDEYFPFCSKRCRTIDLGKWLKGDYLIRRPVEQRDLKEGQ